MTIHSLNCTANTLLAPQFDGRSADYQRWKTQRLHRQDNWHEPDPVEISPELNTSNDHNALAELCDHMQIYGFACYQWNTPCKDVHLAVNHLHHQLSLSRYDEGVVTDSNGLSLLTDLSGTPEGRFIPYTARAMGWHSDGYYNAPSQSLRSFTMHCIQPAASGGALSMMDDQLMLIALYDDDPQLAALLSNPDAMKIPGNKDELGHDRPDRYTAVFFNHADGTLGTHFTTRTRNISWQSTDTHAAAVRMAQLTDHHADWQNTIRLEAGQGIVTRNILHRREAFTDDPSLPPRQMLRGRYHQLPHPPADNTMRQEQPNATR